MSAVASPLLWNKGAARTCRLRPGYPRASSSSDPLFGSEPAGSRGFPQNVHKGPEIFHRNAHSPPASWSAILSAWDFKGNGRGKAFLIIFNAAPPGRNRAPRLNDNKRVLQATPEGRHCSIRTASRGSRGRSPVRQSQCPEPASINQPITRPPDCGRQASPIYPIFGMVLPCESPSGRRQFG